LQYKVDAARTKPAVDTWEGNFLTGGGVLYVLFSLGFCYQFVVGLSNEFGSIRTFRDIHLIDICGGLFGVLFTLATACGAIYMIRNGISTHIQNLDWKRGSTKAHANIVDRQEEQTITADDYKYGGYTLTYELVLRVNDQAQAPELAGRFIRASVGKRIYAKYAWRDSAIIHYATHAPLTFLLHGE
jgi:hypothetical protein